MRLRSVSTFACLALAILVLAGCGGGPGGGGPTREKSPFASEIAAAYSELLSEPEVATASARVRQTIADKYEASGSQRRVLAESPAEWPITPALATDLAAGRARLNQALTGGGRSAFPEAAARAQVSFDCWLMAHADPALASRREDCRGSFRRSLRAVENAGIQGQPRGMADDVVFFGQGSDQLTQSGREAIASVAADASGAWMRILIAGNADRASEPAGSGLAARRAEAVRDALVAEGVPAARIDVRNRGVLPPSLADEGAGGGAMGRRAEIWVL